MESFHIFANAVLKLIEENGKSNIFDLIELIRDDLLILSKSPECQKYFSESTYPMIVAFPQSL